MIALAQLRIHRSVYSRVIAQAQATLDLEVCGLLIGRAEDTVVIEDVVFAPNIAVPACRRFEIDPQVQFDCMRKLRGTAQRIVGHVHSHPAGPPTPSAHDLAMAHDPEAIWVIVGLLPSIDVQAFVRPEPSQGFVRLPLVIE